MPGLLGDCRGRGRPQADEVAAAEVGLPFVLDRLRVVRDVEAFAGVAEFPDEKWGELVMALVVTDGSSVGADDLIAHCRATLAGYKCPKRVEFHEMLPRTATGKLQKFKLREPFWAGRERKVH